MPIFRPDRADDDERYRTSRDVMERCVQILTNCSPANSFLGRKTQEPFPNEDAETRLAKWVGSNALKPPT